MHAAIGILQWKRHPIDMFSAPGLFLKILEKILEGIPG